MLRLAILLVALVLGAPLHAQAPAPGGARTTVAIACSGLGIEFELCREGAEEWARRTGHAVRLVSTPSSGSARLALYQQLLAARAEDIDVFQLDLVWPGILANHLLDLSSRIETEAHFPALVRNNTVDGRLVAVPWFTSAGILYYRRDLLEKYGHRVPETWQELTETARRVMEAERASGNDRFWGYVFQGRAYEGLTVNAIEWLDAHRAGQVVEPDGSISVNNPRAVEALTLAASWVGTITPPGVLNYAEEEARSVFQSGNALFMRNWPYAWPLLNAEDSTVRDKVGVAVLPRGGAEGKPTGALGGEQLAVSRYSRHVEAAVDLVRHLTSPEEQRRRALRGGFNPTIPALYEDRAILEANPFFRSMFGTFENGVPRPSAVTGVRYNRVSAEFANAVHAVLAGQAPAKDALERLERRLERVSRGGNW